MGFGSEQSRAAAIGRFRRIAPQVAAKGMACTVQGSEIRGVLDAYDDACDTITQLQTELASRPKRGKAQPRSFDDEDVRGFAAACGEILSVKAELWAQPLDVAIKAFCADQGEEIPEQWRRIIAP